MRIADHRTKGAASTSRVVEVTIFVILDDHLFYNLKQTQLAAPIMDQAYSMIEDGIVVKEAGVVGDMSETNQLHDTKPTAARTILLRAGAKGEGREEGTATHLVKVSSSANTVSSEADASLQTGNLRIAEPGIRDTGMSMDMAIANMSERVTNTGTATSTYIDVTLTTEVYGSMMSSFLASLQDLEMSVTTEMTTISLSVKRRCITSPCYGGRVGRRDSG